MKYQLKDYNIKIGHFPNGEKNSITDVPGVQVGHISYKSKEIQTGITSIIPHQGNIFKEKLIAASHIINGFGKSIGMIQVDELGTLETPILLTNTLSVGRVTDGLIKYMIDQNPEIGVSTSTVNPLVLECNDGHLNTIQKLFLDEKDVSKALANASDSFEEGSVGAGSGMVCYGLKGGIGSSSRVLILNNREYTIGALVLSNFGKLEDLLLDGINFGEKIKNRLTNFYNKEDQGSIIVILATDIPLEYRQLKRVIKRATHGIAATGTFTSTGSGEVVVGFSTANIIQHYMEEDFSQIQIINENKLNDVFKGTKEAVQEAIYSSLLNADTATGREGHKIVSMREYMHFLKN